MEQAKKLTIIHKRPQYNGLSIPAKKRVCAYCRVSSEKWQQHESYEVQVDHYTKAIQSNPNYEFAGIFADDGISGTSLKKRNEFTRMIEECKKGNIDLIIVKSVSRFARNVVDALKTVRELLAMNVVVFFELQNIYTNDPTAELSLSISASVAQEESRNLSAASKWGIQKRNANPEDRIARLRKILGYDKSEDRTLIINEQEAEIVRRIFHDYLDGKSTLTIARQLEDEGILTSYGGTKWYESTIKKILKNEKYIGDTLAGKTFTVDYLTKKRVDNIRHEVTDAYYKNGTHEPIIDKETFELVQAEIVARSSQRGYGKKGKSTYTSKYSFSNKLYCFECGSKFRRHYYRKSTDTKYHWKCINKLLNGVDKCSSTAILEKDLEDAFVRALNEVLGGKEEIMKILTDSILTAVSDGSLRSEIHAISELIEKKQIELLSTMKLGHRGNDEAFTAGFAEIDALRKERMKIEAEFSDKILQTNREKELIDFIKDNIALSIFDEDIFRKYIEKVLVLNANKVEFVFYAGQRVRQIVGGE